MNDNDLEISGTRTESVYVTVNENDMITSLKKKYGFTHTESCYFLEKKEDGLYWGCDVSTHGSPYYEYTFLTSDKKLIRIYNAIIELENALCRRTQA